MDKADFDKKINDFHVKSNNLIRNWISAKIVQGRFNEGALNFLAFNYEEDNPKLFYFSNGVETHEVPNMIFKFVDNKSVFIRIAAEEFASCEQTRKQPSTEDFELLDEEFDEVLSDLAKGAIKEIVLNGSERKRNLKRDEHLDYYTALEIVHRWNVFQSNLFTDEKITREVQFQWKLLTSSRFNDFDELFKAGDIRREGCNFVCSNGEKQFIIRDDTILNLFKKECESQINDRKFEAEKKRKINQVD